MGNVITLHLNGMVCVFDGLNLTKKYSFKNEGRFFIDICVSPNLYGKKKNGYTEYLLIVLLNDLLIKPVRLEPCYLGKVSGSGCCSFKCFSMFGCDCADCGRDHRIDSTETTFAQSN